jgi:hypothetical protein
MNEIIDRINQIDDAIEADPLYSELIILDWILYKFVVTKQENFEDYNIKNKVR